MYDHDDDWKRWDDPDEDLVSPVQFWTAIVAICAIVAAFAVYCRFYLNQ